MENSKINKAAFGFDNYRFDNVYLNFKSSPIKEDDTSLAIDLDFNPKGIFNPEKNQYELQLEFVAFEKNRGKKDPFIKINAVAFYRFESINKLDDIPNFFYANSLAILYPYIRAFVSSLSVQANAGTLILPTLNLTGLENILKENTSSL
ncbi:MAG: hypothetical protein KFKLKKLM_00717 [Flavobacteriales bacterium]|nr:hypothetical protein [Flavobacteriales bacterium]